MPSPSSSTCSATDLPVARASDRIVVPAGAYFAALSSRLNSTCSNSTASSASIGRSGRELHLDLVLRQDLAGAPQRAADDLADVVRRGVGDDRAGFEPGHVEQIGDEAVEPLGLVDDRGQQLVSARHRSRSRRRSRRVLAAAEDRGQRRLQIVRDRGQQRRAQPLGLDRALDRGPCPRPDARARSRAPPGRSARRAGAARPASAGARLVVSMPTTPIGAAPGAHRQEQALGAGQRVRAAPGRPVVLPRPFGGGEIGFVQRVLRRIAGLAPRSRRLPATAARRAPSASARSDRRSPTARRRASPTPASLRLKA